MVPHSYGRMLFLKRLTWHGTKVVSYLCTSRTLLSDAKRSMTPTIHETREWLKDLLDAHGIWGSPPPGSGMKAVPSPDNFENVKLQVRNMQDSYKEARIPVGSDPMVREKYINFYNGIRIGRILEDLDTFAVAIGYKHNLDPSRGGTLRTPMSIVTALVDRIDLSKEGIDPRQDIMMSGHVTWAGKSSMEITMDLNQEINNSWTKMIQAKFVMVARNPVTKGAVMVNPLHPIGEKEEALFKMGEANKKKRIEEGKKTLLKSPPSEEERLIIHNQFLHTLDPKSSSFKIRVRPENSVWMEDTVLKNLHICFPEQRNLYDKIFGGYLMRKAFELAWANALLYCKQRPFVRVVDDVVFQKPVEVGSLLFMSSQVVYTKGPLIQVKVHAEVVNPKDETQETTNNFHFTFDSKMDSLPTVMPKTYAESMLYLDGKRHFEE
ncbi:hypothetical protein CHS0354_007171 [Potamilus streckersoni]|uniref:HotDog ACOT-type domain-containing protein n=1 Tax=Potamilus streckersoni TaxID=2493646 RepID=A0AAE0T613_9BIVA|nr:hypothetical protein CHS0354_007171 [Potamilus streckersoni]